jgi:hypothetical protein
MWGSFPKVVLSMVDPTYTYFYHMIVLHYGLLVSCPHSASSNKRLKVWQPSWGKVGKLNDLEASRGPLVPKWCCVPQVPNCLEHQDEITSMGMRGTMGLLSWASQGMRGLGSFKLLPTCRRFEPGGVPGPTSKLSPRAPAQMGRRETEREGGKSRRETGVKGETRSLRVCPAPRSGALAVGGYKHPRGRERGAYARAVPSFPARPTFYKRALDLPFIGVRRGSRCTMGGVVVC